MRSRMGCAAFVVAVAGAAMIPASGHEIACAGGRRPGGEWRQFGNQVTGDRTQPEEAFLGPSRARLLHPIWTFDANRASLTKNNEITGYPIVADGCVYVGSSTGFQTPGWLFAINADTGELVWRTRLDYGVYSSVAVAYGRVYAFVSRVKLAGDAQIGGPYVIAVDQVTGKEVWRTTVDYQIGADAVSSPVVHDGMVWVGVSGTAAEVSEGDRGRFQGSSVLLDAHTGDILRKTYTIPEPEWEAGFAGGAQWATIAIDPETGYGFEGTGNPFNYDHEHARTNAVLKIDLARARDAFGAPISSTVVTNQSFGQIVGSYKGTVEEYDQSLSGQIPCGEVEDVAGAYGLGIECARLDLDFGAQPNIFKLPSGRKVVGIGQKSGVYHVFDAETMAPVWKSIIGIPSAVGGIVGSAAFDGASIYGPHTIGGYLFSLDAADGAVNWISPTADGVHWGPPVTHANGVLYTVDLKGFLDAHDAATGAPLLHIPMFLGADTHQDPTFSWGGATVARSTVYASVGVGLTSTELPYSSMPNGFVIAFRPLL